MAREAPFVERPDGRGGSGCASIIGIGDLPPELRNGQVRMALRSSNGWMYAGLVKSAIKGGR